MGGTFLKIFFFAIFKFGQKKCPKLKAEKSFCKKTCQIPLYYMDVGKK